MQKIDRNRPGLHNERVDVCTATTQPKSFNHKTQLHPQRKSIKLARFNEKSVL
jgi:hypothetical protein